MTKTIDLDKHIPALLLVLGGRVALHAVREAARDLDMDLRQWRVIQILGALGPSTISEVSNRVAMDQGGTSRAIAALERRGLIERRLDEADRRRSIAVLTDAGWEMQEEITTFALAREERLLNTLTAAEREQLTGMLHRLIDSADDMLNNHWRPD